MTGWDWTFVAELWVGIGGGLIVGGYCFSAFLSSTFWKLLSHPTARKMASAAEKFSGKQGGFFGFLGDLFGGGDK